MPTTDPRIEAVRLVIAKHHQSFNSVHDEAYETNPVCSECNVSFPCEFRIDLEKALSVK